MTQGCGRTLRLDPGGEAFLEHRLLGAGGVVTAEVVTHLSMLGVPGCPGGSGRRRPNALAWMADRERIPAVPWELPAGCGVEPASSYVETTGRGVRFEAGEF